MGGGNIMGKLSSAFFAFGKARPTAHLFTPPPPYAHWGAVFTLHREGGCGNCCLWVISSAFLLPPQLSEIFLSWPDEVFVCFEGDKCFM